jgi:hypothetical protein
MFVSITKCAGAVLLLGSVLLLGTPDARAQMSAEDTFQAATDQCQNEMKGQRAFCMINAYNHYKISRAAELKQDGMLRIDADSSNDTPFETVSKQNYNSAAAKCATLSKGQRSFCMINAENDYNSGIDR